MAKSKNEYTLTSSQVAFRVGVSQRTILKWYRFKENYPQPDGFPVLPDCKYIEQGKNTSRMWRESDIEALKKFREKLPVGRNGLMGEMTRHMK